MKTGLKLAAVVPILLSIFAVNTLTKESIANPTRNSILPQLVIPAPAYERQIHQTDSEKFQQGRHTLSRICAPDKSILTIQP